ncbi:hypothetical protein AaE_011572 [Aphanomyces astaci]|uniref:Uncharacterized protein n=1 Tax=Aphanomyces astaci TaxID=112090 RepID=A0A6A4ZNI9_APHAT|nr:hypothetical protein AaE_011572 [Aphanomyces astaci]
MNLAGLASSGEISPQIPAPADTDAQLESARLEVVASQALKKAAVAVVNAAVAERTALLASRELRAANDAVAAASPGTTPAAKVRRASLAQIARAARRADTAATLASIQAQDAASRAKISADTASAAVVAANAPATPDPSTPRSQPTGYTIVSFIKRRSSAAGPTTIQNSHTSPKYAPTKEPWPHTCSSNPSCPTVRKPFPYSRHMTHTATPPLPLSRPRTPRGSRAKPTDAFPHQPAQRNNAFMKPCASPP